MADLPEQNQYPDGIYQLETTDPVVGGPDGVSNTQAKQLANRTAWLKAQVEQLLADLQRLEVGDVSGLQAALEGRAARSHNHSASDINSGTLAAVYLPIPTTLARGGHKKATLQDRENGYWRDNESGLLIQWGTLDIRHRIRGWERIGSVTFPLAFTQLFSFTTHFEVNESHSIHHSTTYHASNLGLTGTGNIIGSDAHRGGHRQGYLKWMAIGK